MNDHTKRPPVYRVFTFLLDLVELYVPMVMFTVLFLLFVINVFFRYVLNDPLTWPYELVTVAFVWTAVMAATYVRRIHGHVSFTLFYDGLSPRGQAWSRIAANAFVLVAFAIAIPATVSWVVFMGFKGTSNLKISFTFVYFPIIPFLLLIIGHSLVDVVRDVRALMGSGDAL